MIPSSSSASLSLTAMLSLVNLWCSLALDTRSCSRRTDRLRLSIKAVKRYYLRLRILLWNQFLSIFFYPLLIPLANSKNCGQRKTKSINASNNVRLTRKYILKGKNFEKVYAFRKNWWKFQKPLMLTFLNHNQSYQRHFFTGLHS